MHRAWTQSCSSGASRSSQTDEPLSAHEGRLHCGACKCAVKHEPWAVKQHLATAKHSTAVKKAEARKASDQSVIEDIGQFFKEHPDVVGRTVGLEVQAYRYRVTETLLRAGVEISKADTMRNLLQRSGVPLTDSSHLRSFVPLVEQREIAQTRADVAGQHVCIAFDGTRRLGEAINVTGRFCSDKFEIKTRLLAFVTAAKSYDAGDLVRLLTPILLQQMQLDAKMVVAFARDAVACNGLAMSTLSSIFGSSEVQRTHAIEQRSSWGRAQRMRRRGQRRGGRGGLWRAGRTRGVRRECRVRGVIGRRCGQREPVVTGSRGRLGRPTESLGRRVVVDEAPCRRSRQVLRCARAPTGPAVRVPHALARGREVHVRRP